MAGFVRIVLAVMAGVLLGLLLTIRSLDLDRLGITAGPWHGIPRDGSGGSSNPYALAADARASLLPLGVAEGLTFTATRDSHGEPLRPDCDYLLTRLAPPARFWTLTLLDRQGFAVANPAKQYGYTSAEILRFVGKPATIVVSRAARAGNWLPIGSPADFGLMLRLYDTGLGTSPASITAAVLPDIVKQGCR